MIFVSYSTSDKEFVEKLVRELSSRGLDLWYDRWEIQPGESITARVQQGLRDSDCLVVILSSQSCNAEWVKSEVNSFLHRVISNKKGRLIPVMIEECDPGIFLTDLSQIRFHENSHELALEKLSLALLEHSRSGDLGNILDAFKRANSPEDTRMAFLRKAQKRISDPLAVRADYMILNDQSNLTILKDRSLEYSRVVDIQLCKESWGEGDFSDLLFDTQAPPTIESASYSTNSKYLTERSYTEGKFLHIPWVPRKKVLPGKVYRHKYHCRLPLIFLDPSNAWLHRRYGHPCTWSSFHVHSECPTSRIRVCRAPYTFDLSEEWEFFEYSLRSKDQFSLLDLGRSSLRLQVSSTDIGDGLIVAFHFDGWEQALEMEKQSSGEAARLNFERNWAIEDRFRGYAGWNGLRL